MKIKHVSKFDKYFFWVFSKGLCLFLHGSLLDIIFSGEVNVSQKVNSKSRMGLGLGLETELYLGL